MPRRKVIPENNYDFLETKYGVTPAEILNAVNEVGPYKARLETYFIVHSFLKKSTNALQSDFDNDQRYLNP